jgi:hypothetical protein
MRIRVEFVPIFLEVGNTDSTVTVNVNAWRATVYTTQNGYSAKPMINGVPVYQFMGNLQTGAADFSPTAFTIGGAVVNGRPVMIDQALTFTGVWGGLILEYIDE